MFIGYLIRLNYDPTIISTNHPTLKCPKIIKITKIPPQPKKRPKYPLNLKNDQNTPKPKNDQNNPKPLKKKKKPLNQENYQNTSET